jgi:hypothetical protein
MNTRNDSPDPATSLLSDNLLTPNQESQDRTAREQARTQTLVHADNRCNGRRPDDVRLGPSERELRPSPWAGRGAPVAIEVTYGWYWAVDALQGAGFEVHLAHPSGMKAMRKRRRVKTDAKDSYELANLLRLGSLPQAWIAPVELREIRELVRHRDRLTRALTAVKAGIRALLAKHNIHLAVSDLEFPVLTASLPEDDRAIVG